MTIYHYEAVRIGASASAAHAELLKGELAGETPFEVRAKLRLLGLQVIAMDAAGRSWRDRGLYTKGLLQKRRVAEKIEFFDSLQTMIQSGLPLSDSLESILHDRALSGIRIVILQILEKVKSGESLSSAMREQDLWFTKEEVAIVEAGEHGGTLGDVLGSCARRCERRDEMTQKITGALMYPSVVLVAGAGAFLYLTNATIPQLLQILADAKVKPPAFSAVVVAIGQGMLQYGWIVLLFVMAAIVSIRRFAPPPPAFVSNLVSKFGLQLRETIVRARIAKSLSDLLEVGIPLVDAIRIVSTTLRAPKDQQTMEQVANNLERGETLSVAFSKSKLWGMEMGRVLEMAHVTGEFASVFHKFGEREERRARRAIERFTAMIEPAAIVFLAILIGLVVMAAVLPLASFQQILR